MIRTLIWFIWFCISLILTLPPLLAVKLITNQNTKNKIVYIVTRLWAKPLLWLSGSKFQVEGEENIPEGPVLYVGNHQSNFDIPIFISCINRPKAFISKLENSKIPIVSIWMKEMKCIFMDRKDIRKSIEAINLGVEYLKQGYSMVIFPEGTRSGSGEMGEFKAGSFKLAFKSGVPIVPVAIDGSYNIMTKGSLIIKPAKVKITVFKPIYTSDLSKEELKKIPEQLENQIKDYLSK
jgi:1-acyl-sn-glycerol-3-phosphate acyltransferase